MAKTILASLPKIKAIIEQVAEAIDRCSVFGAQSHASEPNTNNIPAELENHKS